MPSSDGLPMINPWAIARPRGDRFWSLGPVARWAAVLMLGAWGPILRLLAEGREMSSAIAVGGCLCAGALLIALPRRWQIPAYVLASVSFLLLVAPSGGRRAIGLALLGVLAAHGVLPTSSSRMRGMTPTVGLGVPLLMLGGILWIRGPRSRIDANIAYNMVGLVSAVCYLGVLVVPGWAQRHPKLAARVAGHLGRVGKRLGSAAAGLILFLTAFVFLYLPGSIVNLVRHLAVFRRPTGWRMRANSVDTQRKLAAYPFGATPVKQRRRGHAVTGFVVLLGASLLLMSQLGGAGKQKDSSAESVNSDGGSNPVKFSDLPSYRNVPFADELQAEQKRFSSNLLKDDTTITRSPNFDGDFTTVDAGVRTTRESTCQCPTVSVWLTGGSVAFGLGQRDQRTIASDLVGLAEADGIALDIENLAVPGWTIYQERLLLEQRLQSTDAPPDVIVSYGGFNDVAATLTSSAVHGVDERAPSVLIHEDTESFERQGLSAEDGGGVDRLSNLAAERYDRERVEIQKLAATYGSEPVFFFHPDALASPLQFDPVANIVRGLPESVADQFSEMLERTSKLLQSDVLDDRHLFDAFQSSVFVDWAHTNEVGAQAAAESMYAAIRPSLIGLAS